MNRILLSLFVAGFIIVAGATASVSTPTVAVAASCTGTWQYQESDLSDLACVSGSVSTACVPDPNKTNVYSAVPTCPTANPEGATCTVGSPVLRQGVSGPKTYGNTCKWNSVAPSSNIVQTDLYSCVDAGGVPISLSCAAPVVVTAALVANPTSILNGEQSLLTWSSTGATSCSGTNFTTGGATSDSVIVSPSQTTIYTVTCTNNTSSASASATVTVETIAPQCSDGIDNDGDGKIDYAWRSDYPIPNDPGCSSALDDDETDGATPQCSDGIDNDSDGNTDTADASCHTDGDAMNGGSYNPGDVSEAAPQCSDGIDNDGNGTIDYPNDVGCSSASDNDEYSPKAGLSIKATPPLVKSGEICKLAVSATNVTSCTFSGGGISKTLTPDKNGAVSEVIIDSGKLIGTTDFTLTCQSPSGTVSQKAQCKVTPRFEEF